MDFATGKRARKPVNYAIMDGLDDDDFSEFTPPVKKRKDEKDKPNKEKESSKSSSSQDSVKVHDKSQDSENKHDRESHDKRKDRDRDSRDRHSKDRDRNSDNKKKDKYRDRDKDKSRESRDKSSSQDDRHRHKKSKKRDRRGKDEELEDPDFIEKVCSPKSSKNPLTSVEKSPARILTSIEKSPARILTSMHSPKSSNEDVTSTEKSPRTSKKPSTSTEKLPVRISAVHSPKSSNQSSTSTEKLPTRISAVHSPKSSNQPLTSTQVSPARITPKPRLTVEERMFQRELEAAMALSKMSTTSKPTGDKEQNTSSLTDDKEEEPKKLELQAEAEVNGSLSPVHSPELESCKSPIANKTAVEVLPTCDSELSEPKVNLHELEAISNDRGDKEDPQPSTSSGATHKRQRKKVVFFEESDSDSFDGFGGSDLSEESDFVPSPVKKKGKQKVKVPKKSKSPKLPKVTTEVSISKSGVALSAKEKTAPVAEVSISKSRVALSAKEKTAPVAEVSISKSGVALSAKENTAPVAEVSISKSGVTPPLSAKENTVPVARVAVSSAKANSTSNKRLPNVGLKVNPSSSVNNKSNISTSAASAARTGLVKVPFRSPVIQSSGGSTPNYVPKSPNTLHKIGVRLGLSRSNFKPLHPSVSGK